MKSLLSSIRRRGKQERWRNTENINMQQKPGNVKQETKHLSVNAESSKQKTGNRAHGT